MKFEVQSTDRLHGYLSVVTKPSYSLRECQLNIFPYLETKTCCQVMLARSYTLEV